ncbi:beta-N-acetylhexosaminidase [Roseomonas sp. CCTCC AB2023176]|uniref:beta-N-acetylhexosaminidase n=1 Tax=Roseomonas sp. CCTCC AB2023176 TaxID=3342640 RepID=UPI0035D9451C
MSGPTLTAEEATLLRDARPVGVILFRRNVTDPAQVTALTAAIRDVLGADAPILVDQEGGRVARLRPPHWPSYPAAAAFEGAPATRAAAAAALLGAECARVGLDVACAPCLDLQVPGAHGVIGDRAFSADPDEVARLGLAWVEGLMAAGIQPVIKHVPGHGRATADSHDTLPRVTADCDTLAADLLPFATVVEQGRGRHLWAMTAHVTFDAWDALRPATLSPRIISEIIRGQIGFDGVLVCDDLQMGALAGLSNDLAADALDAGCDLVLHCSGVLAESAALLRTCPHLTHAAAARLHDARVAALTARIAIPPGVALLAVAPDPTARPSQVQAA